MRQRALTIFCSWFHQASFWELSHSDVSISRRISRWIQPAWNQVASSSRSKAIAETSTRGLILQPCRISGMINQFVLSGSIGFAILPLSCRRVSQTFWELWNLLGYYQGESTIYVGLKLPKTESSAVFRSFGFLLIPGVRMLCGTLGYIVSCGSHILTTLIWTAFDSAWNSKSETVISMYLFASIRLKKKLPL